MSESETVSRDTFETPDETLPVEWVDRTDLLPNDWNPNSMTEGKREELVHSILDNGWTQPIIRKKGTDKIIDGEQRWHASGDTRVSENAELTPDGVDAGHVPVFDLDAGEAQARIASMQMNVATGEHDATALGEILADFDADERLDEATDHLNMDDVSVNRLLERADTPDGESPEPEELFDFPEYEDAGEDVMTTRVDLLVTEFEEARAKQLLRQESMAQDLVNLCRWAIANDVHLQTRVDARQNKGLDPSYSPEEGGVEGLEADDV